MFPSLELLNRIPHFGLGQLVAPAARRLDEARDFAREAVQALWLLLLVACCTTPVLLRGLLDALAPRPRPLALLPGAV